MNVLIFILSCVGFGLYSSYFLYRQIYFGVVRHSRSIIKHISVLGLSAFILWLMGYILSTAIVKTFDQDLAWISIPIFVFLGIRMFAQARKTNELNWTFNSNTFKTMFFMSMLVNFDAFFLGFAIGLLKYSFLFPVLFLFVLLIFMILLSFMAQRKSATLAVWLLAAMGAILIGLNSLIVLYMLVF